MPGDSEMLHLAVRISGRNTGLGRRLKTIAAPFKRRGLELFAISAATGEGVPQLLEAAWRILASTPNPIATSGMSADADDGRENENAG